MNFLMRVSPARAPVQNFSRLLHTSGVTFNFTIRRRLGLPLSLKDEPELLENPDYSYLDGRATPLSLARKKRLAKQKWFANRAVELLGEVNYCLKRQELKEERQRQEEEHILSRKLKPKGVVYKPKDSTSENA